jgi:hypothetical protein
LQISAEKILLQPEQILNYLNAFELKNSYVYISGSLMEGFGNHTSDVDVYVICNEIPVNPSMNDDCLGESFLWEGNTLVRNLIHEGVRFDFEYWTVKDFNNAVRQLRELDFKKDEHIARIQDTDFVLLHRLKYAKPLLNVEEFMEFHSTIPFENLGFYQAVIMSERFTSFVEDIQGALLSDDLGSAFFMVRRLVELSAVSYLGIQGETNPNLKWMYRKIIRYQEQSGDNNFLEKYMHFQTHPFEKSTVKEFIKKAMRFAQDLNSKTQLALQVRQRA